MSGSSGILPQLAWPRPVSQGRWQGFQSKSVMDLMSIDLFCATSDRMPESVPVLSGSCRGTVIVWTGGSLVSQPYVATLLTDHPVAKALKGVDQAIPGHATWKSHAASTAINSSFT